MSEVQGRGSRFAGVENPGLQRPTDDEAPARVQSMGRERSLQQEGRINGGAEWVPPLDRTAYGPDLPLRVSRRSRSLATLHSQHDAAGRAEPTGCLHRRVTHRAEGMSVRWRDAARAQRLRAEALAEAGPRPPENFFAMPAKIFRRKG